MKNVVRELRKRLGSSQAEFARSVGISRQTLSAIETGEEAPRLPVVFRIARVLNMPIASIFFEDTSPPASP